MGPSGLYLNIGNLNDYTSPAVAQSMYPDVQMASVVPGPRIMSVTIPANAAPGSTMTVLAPDNVTKVTVGDQYDPLHLSHIKPLLLHIIN